MHVSGAKKNPKAKNRTNSTKEYSEQFGGTTRQQQGFEANCSEECQKPQPPLLLKKAPQYTSNFYRNTPPICTTVLSLSLRSEEREICQYSSHLYRRTPPICIVIRLPLVSRYFGDNLGGSREEPYLSRLLVFRRRAEYGFGEYGFKHRAQ